MKKGSGDEGGACMSMGEWVVQGLMLIGNSEEINLSNGGIYA